MKKVLGRRVRCLVTPSRSRPKRRGRRLPFEAASRSFESCSFSWSSLIGDCRSSTWSALALAMASLFWRPVANSSFGRLARGLISSCLAVKVFLSGSCCLSSSASWCSCDVTSMVFSSSQVRFRSSGSFSRSLVIRVTYNQTCQHGTNPGHPHTLTDLSLELCHLSLLVPTAFNFLYQGNVDVLGRESPFHWVCCWHAQDQCSRSMPYAILRLISGPHWSVYRTACT